MIILCLRTDKPVSEIYIYQDSVEVSQIKWEAHRKLADTLNSKINELLKSANLELKDIEKIVFYKGPGSFTGLRIGASVASAIAYSNDIPLVATNGEKWINEGLISDENNKRMHEH